MQEEFYVKIRKNDEVQVMAGKDLGKEGKVHSVNPDGDKVVVAGVNMIKRHQKAGKVRTQAGIIQRERRPFTSPTSCWCATSATSPLPGRFCCAGGRRKVRACKKCGEVMEVGAP